MARVVRVKVAKTIQPNDRCQLITRVGPKKPLAWPRADTGAVWGCVWAGNAHRIAEKVAAGEWFYRAREITPR